MTRRVLVVAAHADDEALGCGGALARHAADGDETHLVILADGVSSRGESSSAATDERLAAARMAASVLGIRSLRSLGLPDNRLDAIALLDVVQPLEAVVAELDPDLVYTHHPGDLNVDHRIAHEAVLTACRPIPGSRVREILAFEVMSSTGWGSAASAAFRPNVFVDISAQLETKLRALAAYRDEMRPAPHARSFEHVRNLAAHRGYSVGLAAAEAFELVRSLR